MIQTYMPIFVMAAAISARADDGLPKRLDFDRYKGMLEHSPFAVATAVVAPAAAPSICNDLYIANAARTPDGDSVTIMSTSDREFKKYLTTKTPVDGYALANVDWSDKVGETKVTVSKDGQFCSLTFNQNLVTQPMPNRPGALPGVQPAPVQIPLQRPPVISTPAAAAPNPHIRGVIQRNPQPQFPVLPGVSPPPAPPQN
jgi:hypothetical protein